MDAMGWVKLDDGFFRNPKVLQVGRDAKVLYLAGLCYSGSALTDGFIPANAPKVLAADAEVASAKRPVEELVQAGLWIPVEGGFQVHDYLEFNQSAERVRANRDAAKERMQRNRSQNVRANKTRSSREVREQDTDTDTDTDVGDTPTPPARAGATPKPSGYSPEFETFWRAYPSGHGAKKQAWEQWQRLAKDEETQHAIVAALPAWKASDRWQRGYVKDAQRWLRDRQWLDTPPPPPEMVPVAGTPLRAVPPRDIGLSNDDLERIARGERLA